MSTNWDVMVFFRSMANFEQSGGPNSGRTLWTYIFIKSNVLSYKNWKHSSHTIALGKGTIFT